MEIPMDISTWDDKCMQAFIRENASMFRVFAFRYLQDEEAVDDVLQESYMKLWINRSKIGSVKSPRNYFFSIIKLSRSRAFPTYTAIATRVFSTIVSFFDISSTFKKST